MFGTSQEPQLIRSNHALVTHLLPKAHVEFSGERIVAMARDAASTFIPPSAVSERDCASLVFCKGSQDRVIEFAHAELLPNRLQGGRPCVGLSTLSTILPLPFVDVHIAVTVFTSRLRCTHEFRFVCDGVFSYVPRDTLSGTNSY